MGSTTCNLTLAVMPRKRNLLIVALWDFIISNKDICSNALHYASSKSSSFNPAASMNIGSTAGIAAGVAIALLLFAIIIYCCCCRKKNKEEEYAMG